MIVSSAALNGAPKTLEQLRALVIRMQNNEAPSKLGSRAMRALVSIVESPRQAAVSSISELAESAGIDPSTLSRLSRKLGYRGFSEFQDVFRHHVADEHHFYSARARRLLRDARTGNNSDVTAARIFEEEGANIFSTLEHLSARELDASAEKLIEARRVCCYGARQMHALACFLSYGLGMLRSDVSVLSGAGNGVAHGLAQLEADDVLIVASCSPYTRETIDTARIAAGRSLVVIALTDSPVSPLAAVARHSFACATGGSFFANSVASLFVLSESLLTVVAELLGARTLQQLRRREALINELGIEL